MHRCTTAAKSSEERRLASRSTGPPRRAHPRRRPRAPPAGRRPGMLDASDFEPSADDNAVSDFLLILEEHRKNCERAGKYVEADIAKKRLAELRSHEESRQQENLRSRQVAQRLGIEEAHMLEFQQFNSMWDRTMKEYEERAGELLEAMRQRHELDLRELRQKRAADAPAKVRQSSKLLDLRRTEGVLARQGEYAEAHKVNLLR